MKYWRGYLVAAILAVITWAFRDFAQTHSKLVDMIYPYVTRMVQNYMAGWSAGADFCVWQIIIFALAIAFGGLVILMLIFRWSPIQLFGWVLAVMSMIVLLHTGIFGMNEFAGPLAEDIRLAEAECSDEQLEAAAIYYRDKANALVEQVEWNADGTMKLPSLEELSARAENGFNTLVYKNYFSVFAGSNLAVKELGLASIFTARGEMGYTAAITGEAAVNMEAPSVMIPFAVCREMCYRRCIASDRDKHFGAFLACQANENPEFQYSGYIMAYRYCLNALPKTVAATVDAEASEQVRSDVDAWEVFIAPSLKIPEPGLREKLEGYLPKKYRSTQEDPMVAEVQIADLLIRWHYEVVVLPSITEPEYHFDPYNEKQVDLTGLPHVKKKK